ncbi:oligosaccharide flippase family protein [Shewanella scandinavica]|uniref:oligosaccharide flippase family protein n=1 Tax=Shewanella scandinavica TaxID=3063538 RepID=UPI003192A302
MSIKVLNKAIIENLIGKFALYFVHIITLLIFSRVFTPYEFGVIASIQVFILFFQLFSDLGIGPALVNEDEISETQRNGIFTFTLILGLLISLLFYFFSYFLNYYYDGFKYQDVALVICFSILFTCLSIVPVTSLTKDLSFIKLAKVEIVAHSVSGLIAIILHSQIDPVIALVSKTTTYSIIRFSISMFWSKKTALGRPSLGKNITYVKKILGFSLYQFGFNFINYFARNLDSILVAKYLGNIQLGMYDRAYQIMRYPVMLTTGAFSSALQPVLSKSRDINFIIQVHNNLSAKLLCISLPITLFIFTCSSEVVLFALGPGWSGVEPLVIAFSFSLPIQILISTSGSFFQSINKPRLLFLTGCIGSSIFIICIIISMLFKNIEVTALAISISFIINSFSIYFILFKFGFCIPISGFIIRLILVVVNLSPSLFMFYFISNQFIHGLELSNFSFLMINLITLAFCHSFKFRFIMNQIKS